MDITIECRVFQLYKDLANSEVNKAWLSIDRSFEKKLESMPELHDAKVLYRLFLREIDEHNAKIQAKMKAISNLKYQGGKSYKSKLFNGVFHSLSIAQIRQVVENNPDKTNYEMYVIYCEKYRW